MAEITCTIRLEENTTVVDTVGKSYKVVMKGHSPVFFPCSITQVKGNGKFVDIDVPKWFVSKNKFLEVYVVAEY